MVIIWKVGSEFGQTSKAVDNAALGLGTYSPRFLVYFSSDQTVLMHNLFFCAHITKAKSLSKRTPIMFLMGERRSSYRRIKPEQQQIS